MCTKNLKIYEKKHKETGKKFTSSFKSSPMGGILTVYTEKDLRIKLVSWPIFAAILIILSRIAKEKVIRRNN